jgi:hypothetical protein
MKHRHRSRDGAHGGQAHGLCQLSIAERLAVGRAVPLSATEFAHRPEFPRGNSAKSLRFNAFSVGVQ